MTTSRPIARRHHTVPLFYLRGFAKDEQIATVRLPGQRRFLQSVRDATVAKDFYALDGHEDGPDAIERALSDIEGATATVFQKIADGVWPLDAEDRATLSYFIALQATRVPAQRRTVDHLAAQMLRLQIGAGGKAGLRAELEKDGREVGDKLVDTMWEQATRPEGPPVKRSKAEHIGQMLELSEELLKYIIGRPWSLVRFGARSLITSDAPVGLVRNPNDESRSGVGFVTASGITFPLSRKIGLIMSDVAPLIELEVPVEEVHRGIADTVQAGSTSFERFFNGYTTVNASEWLFHHPDDERFVPADLPDPRPFNVQMDGVPESFTGEPWFGPTEA